MPRTEFFIEQYAPARIASAIEWHKAEAEKIAALPDFDEAIDGKYAAASRRAAALLASITTRETLERDEDKMAAEYILMAESGESYC